MFTNLCQPAKFYLTISIIYYILILLQNIGSHDRFYLGSYFLFEETGFDF